MEGQAALLEQPQKPVVEAVELVKPQPNIVLPESANGGIITHAQLGSKREYKSFNHALEKETERNNIEFTPQIEEQADQLFIETDKEITPRVLAVIKEMRRLNIRDDLLLPQEFELLRYGIKADQWGQRPKKDLPNINDTNYTPDPENPLNQVLIKNGKIEIKTLNLNLYSEKLITYLQELYDSSIRIGQLPELKNHPKLRDWVEHQAISRGILKEKKEFIPLTIDINDSKEIDFTSLDEQDKLAIRQKLSPHQVEILEKDGDKHPKLWITPNGEIYISKKLGAAQASNEVEVWEDREGRRAVIKHGAESIRHTLQAEILENRFMQLMGIPVPETNLQQVTRLVKDTKGQLRYITSPIITVGFLEGYKEEENPFVLSDKYHTNEVLQQGLIIDLWLNQYNRRPHNVMMKDGKIAFIDHGAALFGRATGGLKEFPSQIGTANAWDILRTIPDNNPNGDVPVNEAYDQILSVEGGPSGSLVVKNREFLRLQLQRLEKISDTQITQIVEEAGFQDGPESLELIKYWLNSDSIKGRLEKLSNIPEASRTNKDRRDLRWTEGIQKELAEITDQGGIIEADGTKIPIEGLLSYMIYKLKSRRASLLDQLGPLVGFERRATEKQYLAHEIKDRFWAAMELVTANNASGNYNFKAALEILIKSLREPESIPDSGYGKTPDLEIIKKLKTPIVESAAGIKEILESESIQLRKDALLELLRINPPINPGSIETLVNIARNYDLRIWTLGDMDNQEHTLPSGLISTPQLEGSEHQFHKLDNSKVVEQVRESLRAQGQTDRHIEASISSDKFAQLPFLVDQLQAAGNNHFVIFDDSFSSLEKAQRVLESLPSDQRPTYTLVLVNQGRKYTQSPKRLETKNTNGEFRVISASSATNNDALNNAPELVREVQNSQPGGKPAVLMDFDGVVTDNGQYRKLQEQTIFRVFSPYLSHA